MTRANGSAKKWSPASFMGAGAVTRERSKLQAILSISTIGNAVLPQGVVGASLGERSRQSSCTASSFDEVIPVDWSALPIQRSTL
jgi:hypothetical protein